MKVANLTYSKVDNLLTCMVTSANPIYLIAVTTITSQNFVWLEYYSFSLELTNKGIETVYEKIQDTLIVVDLSNNRFEGEIPEVIGNLMWLHLLNLSNNCLTGHIPSSLGNLTELESLDFSQNNLSERFLNNDSHSLHSSISQITTSRVLFHMVNDSLHFKVIHIWGTRVCVVAL